MKRMIYIRPEAEQDMREAYTWYEKQMPGLGSNFLLHVDAQLRSIQRLLYKIRSFNKKSGVALSAAFLMVFFIWLNLSGLSFWLFFMPSATPRHGRRGNEQNGMV